MRAGGVVVVAAAALLSFGCDAGGGDRITVRDSAGVTIVENTLPPESALPWRIDPAPFRVIGTADGEERYQLYLVRGATRLSDGSVAVVNGGTNELRVFGADGTLLGVAGGEGDGPGEFRAMRLAGRLPGDSLLLFDSRHARFTVVAPGPAITTTFTLDPRVAQGSVETVGVLGDGRIVVAGPVDFGEPADASVIEPPRPLILLDGGGGLQATLDTVRTRPMYFEMGDGFSFTFVPFTVPPAFAVAGDAIHAGSGRSYEVRRYDPHTRRLARLIRLEREPRPVTGADLDRFIERAVERADPGRGPALRESYAEVPPPDVMPAYRDLLVDRAGLLWVADYRAHGGEPRRWTVFDPDGRVLGTVDTPDGVRVLEVGHDWILGIRRDELDIPYVVMHRLDRASGSGPGDG